MINNKTLEAIRARRARQAGVVEEKPKRGKAKAIAEKVRDEESPALQEQEPEEDAEG
jgi:hypothetical protein